MSCEIQTRSPKISIKTKITAAERIASLVNKDKECLSPLRQLPTMQNPPTIKVSAIVTKKQESP